MEAFSTQPSVTEEDPKVESFDQETKKQNETASQ